MERTELEGMIPTSEDNTECRVGSDALICWGRCYVLSKKLSSASGSSEMLDLKRESCRGKGESLSNKEKKKKKSACLQISSRT